MHKYDNDLPVFYGKYHGHLNVQIQSNVSKSYYIINQSFGRWDFYMVGDGGGGEKECQIHSAWWWKGVRMLS